MFRGVEGGGLLNESARTSQSHKLKTWPDYFQAVWEGRKKFDLRRDDRDYQVGDMLLLREYDPGKPKGCPQGCPLRHLHDWERPPVCYTGRELTARIDYVMRGGRFGLKRGNVVLSITVMQRATSSTRLPKMNKEAP